MPQNSCFYIQIYSNQV